MDDTSAPPRPLSGPADEPFGWTVAGYLDYLATLLTLPGGEVVPAGAAAAVRLDGRTVAQMSPDADERARARLAAAGLAPVQDLVAAHQRGVVAGEVGWYVPAGAWWCPRCGDQNFDAVTRRCITCTDGDSHYAGGVFAGGWSADADARARRVGGSS